jgi:hypothetical protein
MTSESEDISNGGIYKPLDASRREIRLLWLLPSTRTTASQRNSSSSYQDSEDEDKDEDDPIHAELITVSLLDKPAYTALSYVWGDPNEPRRDINVNGQQFATQPNLHSALKHLRQCGIGVKEQPDPSRPYSCPGLDDRSEPAIAGRWRGKPLWIDAICINQNDILERNSQVLLMGEIYRNRGVVSWLGDASYRLKGLQLARELSWWWKWSWEEAWRQAIKARAEGPETELLSPNTEFPVPEILGRQIEAFINATQHLWLAEHAAVWLEELFNYDYWRRVWVVQEIVLAQPLSHVYMCRGEFATDDDFAAP